MQTISHENIYSWNELYETSMSTIERATNSLFPADVQVARFAPEVGIQIAKFAPAQEEQEEKTLNKNYMWTTHLPTAVQQATALFLDTKKSHYSTSIGGAANAMMHSDRIARAVERTKEMRAMRRLK